MNPLPLSGELAAQARETARAVNEHFNDQAGQLRDAADSARYHAEDFIRTNPWPAIGLAAGIGFLLGVAVARR